MNNKTALIVVDMQNDFCEGGALGVSGGTAAVAVANRLLEEGAHDIAVGTRDWHEQDSTNGGHIAVDTEPDFVDTWPVHCVQGSYGAQYADDLDVNSLDFHITKGMGVPAYSGFEGFQQGGRTTLNDLLRENGVSHLRVVGIATDYCVKATVLDGLAFGYTVEVVSDGTAAVADFAGAIDEMRAAGATIVTSGV